MPRKGHRSPLECDVNPTAVPLVVVGWCSTCKNTSWGCAGSFLSAALLQRSSTKASSGVVGVKLLKDKVRSHEYVYAYLVMKSDTGSNVARPDSDLVHHHWIRLFFSSLLNCWKWDCLEVMRDRRVNAAVKGHSSIQSTADTWRPLLFFFYRFFLNRLKMFWTLRSVPVAPMKPSETPAGSLEPFGFHSCNR